MEIDKEKKRGQLKTLNYHIIILKIWLVSNSEIINEETQQL